jgi:predicted ATPase
MEHKEINKLRDQFQSGQFPKFLNHVTINGIRSWNGQQIDFKFPIVAIAGENGTGKSTILKSVACAWEGSKKNTKYYPTDFFIETPWESITNANIDFNLKEGNNIVEFSFRKKSSRWRSNKPRPKNEVYILEVSRTLPLDATAGYARVAKLAVSEISRDQITDEYRGRLSHILGKDYTSASFAKTDFDNKKEVGLLGNANKEISQYHQGAGEDATLDLMRVLQEVPNYSLLIIDEVEASLHPKSQRRLIRFLLWFCRQKKCQIVLSTHSPYIFQELPIEARIMLLSGNSGTNIVTGVSPEFAMSKLDDMDYPEMNIYVEDTEAEIWLREIIVRKENRDDLITRTKIAPGYESKLPTKTLAFVDGDKDIVNGCFKLPGDEAPEVTVFEQLKQKNWANLPERFGIGSGTLFQVLESAMLDPDHHKWPILVGDRTRKSGRSVWEILTSEWCRTCLTEENLDYIVEKIDDKLNAN